MLRELEEYVASKGWQFKESRERGGLQVRILNECPFCGKPKKLYFNADDGRWDCKRCGEKGNLLVMKRRLGDLTVNISSATDLIRRGPRRTDPLEGNRPPQGTDHRFHRNLMSDEGKAAMEYLTEVRAFTPETVERFNLGLVVKAAKPMLTIPHYFAGELVNMKMRTLPPAQKSFSRWAGCPSVLFNGDSIAQLSRRPPRERTVYMCEGETDAIAMVQLGFDNVVASTAGASSWPEQWLKPLEPATTIFLVYDDDEAGDAGAEKAASILGRYRCRRVTPPLHDVAECVAAGLGREALDEAIKNARDLGERTVRSVLEFGDDLLKNLLKPEPKGNSTGWITLDSVIGGVRDGESTVVTGDTGSGKSTWVSAWARNQALQGKPVLIAPFEQKPWEVLAKLTSMSAEESVFEMSKARIEAAFDKVCKLPLYFLDKHGPTPLTDIKDAVYLGVSRFGIQRVVVDHLHYSLDCDSHNERHAIKEYVQQVEMWSKDLDIHILLVVHPAKLGKDPMTGTTRKVELDDLKGASDIKQIMDNAIRVYRHREDSHGTQSDKTEIAVMKCRSPAGSEGSMWFHFDARAERYIDGAYPPGEGAGATSNRSPSDPWQTWDRPQ